MHVKSKLLFLLITAIVCGVFIAIIVAKVPFFGLKFKPQS